MSIFSERLRQVREKRGVLQLKIADDLKIGRSTYSNYEQGQREPSFEMLEAIADYLNVDINYLLGKTDIERQWDFDDLALQAKQNQMLVSQLDGIEKLNILGIDKLQDYLNDLIEIKKYTK